MKRLKLTVLFVLIIFAASLLVSGDIFITSSSPSLKIGDKGTQVEELQQRLSNMGLYTGSINGE
ncbi:MAG TPA: spore cortex-lytic enzyme, partial [Clostridia bacterium]|nr:spore cortex-lytic enzyme [Clostridia bacterium]